MKMFRFIITLAFLLNINAGFFNVPDLGAMLGDESANNERILICTVDGLRWINLDGSENNDQPSGGVKCPVCMAGGYVGGIVYNADIAEELIPQNLILQFMKHGQSSVFAHNFVLINSPRAPPIPYYV